MPIGEIDYVIRSIGVEDLVNKFKISREQDALRAFLKKSAHDFHSQNIAKTYVLVEKDSTRILSYISILLSEIKKEYATVDECPEAKRYNYPAIKIARLATDKHYEGKTFGRTLVSYVAGLAIKHVMPFAGCRFLILDANREKIQFYKRCGSILVDNEENNNDQNPVMFMDLHKIMNPPAAN